MYTQTTGLTPQLQQWLAHWPAVRREVEELMESHAELEPSLHFQLTLATLELNDIDETMQRLRALGRLLASSSLIPAELEATGNR